MAVCRSIFVLFISYLGRSLKLVPMYPKSIAYHSHCIPLETVPTFLILYHLEVYPRSLCIQSYISYELQKKIVGFSKFWHRRHLDTIFAAAINFFVPSRFVTALAQIFVTSVPITGTLFLISWPKNWILKSKSIGFPL